MSKIRVRTFYQADPVGTIPGGVDTFIRGLIKFAPDDFEFSVVGMSTDPVARPVGRWTECRLGDKTFPFFAAISEMNPGGRATIPWTLQLTVAIYRYFALVSQDFDVFEFHRPEPMIPFRHDSRAKNAFFHQSMMILYNESTDFKWRKFPGVYFWIEDQLLPRLDSGYCVSEEGLQELRRRFAAMADKFKFQPTWVDTDVFAPEYDAAARQAKREALRKQCGFAAEAKVVVTVGRIDSQKNPLLLLDSFALLAAQFPELALAYIGDGVLKSEVENRVRELGLSGRVHFFGLLPAAEIAQILQAVDVFALSSAYEGMPMALLEGLGAGLPAVTTDVGEVRKVVNPDSGEIVIEHTPEAFSRALASVLRSDRPISAQACVAAIADYVPAKVLRPVYDNYRLLGEKSRALV